MGDQFGAMPDHDNITHAQGGWLNRLDDNLITAPQQRLHTVTNDAHSKLGLNQIVRDAAIMVRGLLSQTLTLRPIIPANLQLQATSTSQYQWQK